MVQEGLARRFKPAGFEQPEGSRHEYTKPSPELQEAFYRWIDDLPEKGFPWEESENQYQKAVKALKELEEISHREANSILVDFKPKTKGQKKAGLFISACYTHSSEDIVVFDVDAPEIDMIGYKTKKNIFNNGKVGSWFAWNSSGLAVNNSDCGNWFASESSGLAVNNGGCRDDFAESSSGLAINNGGCRDSFAWDSSGLAIAVKEPKSYGYREKSRRTIKPAYIDRNHDLKKYIEELSEITRNIKDEQSAKKFLERYGTKPKERVEQEVKEILKNGGFKI